MDFYSFLTIIGGLAFFLFGMHLMSRSLEKAAGGKLESLLKKMTEKPLVSLALGAIITIAMQSSSATTVMLVGLVNSGILSFAKTVTVCFGANIGTTLTGWILSLSGIEGESFWLQMLKPIHFSPILAFIGAMLLLFSKKERKQSIGSVFLGFAILMYGMTMMSDAVKPLTESDSFGTVMQNLGNPIAGLLASLLFTAVVQSSAATIGILQALSLTGTIPISAVIPMIMGLNIGTCATSMISGIGAGTDARRVSFAHLSIKVIGTLVCLPVYLIMDGIFQLEIFRMAATPVSVALLHTLYNVLITLILIPFTKWIVKLAETVIKEPTSAASKDDFCRLDERLFRSPSVAIGECSDLSIRMSEFAGEILKNALSLLNRWDAETEKRILLLEDRLDLMQDRLGTYLVRLSPHAVSQRDSRSISKMLHTVGDFERLGDHAVNLTDLCRQRSEKDYLLSPEAQRELSVLCNATNAILDLTLQAFSSDDPEKAKCVEPLEQVIDGLTLRIRDNHINRLRDGICSMEMDFWLSEWLINFERISDHCSNIAVAVIEAANDSFDTHRYLNSMKYDNPEFTDCLHAYEQTFCLD